MARNLKGRMFILGTTVAVMAFGAVSCTATRVSDLEGRTISDVEVRFTGSREIDEKRIKGFMRTNSGGRYSADLLDDDIRSLYESGLVSDVSMTAIPQGELVRVVTEVELRPLPGPLFCVGNTAFSHLKLAKQSGLRKSSDVTLEELDSACRKLERFYRKHGYANARVRCRAFGGGPPKPDDFIFVVEEGSKVA